MKKLNKNEAIAKMNYLVDQGVDFRLVMEGFTNPQFYIYVPTESWANIFYLDLRSKKSILEHFCDLVEIEIPTRYKYDIKFTKKIKIEETQPVNVDQTKENKMEKLSITSVRAELFGKSGKAKYIAIMNDGSERIIRKGNPTYNYCLAYIPQNDHTKARGVFSANPMVDEFGDPDYFHIQWKQD